MTMQLPPLTDVMYHAARGLEYEFSSGGDGSVRGFVDDDMLDDVWRAINTALRVAAPEISDPRDALVTELAHVASLFVDLCERGTHIDATCPLIAHARAALAKAPQ